MTMPRYGRKRGRKRATAYFTILDKEALKEALTDLFYEKEEDKSVGSAY